MTATDDQASEQRTLRCPRDGAPLALQKYEANIEVDICASCNGVWLDAGELEAIQSTVERDYERELDTQSGTEPPSAADLARSSSHGPIQCPKCGGPMESREYGYSSQVVIDACVDGCGVWLDEGELRALEIFFERHRRESSLPVSWRIWATLLSVIKRKR